jgi:hypothetical protein
MASGLDPTLLLHAATDLQGHGDGIGLSTTVFRSAVEDGYFFATVFCVIWHCT